MPWLLYRYLIGELVRVIGLTTAVLVTVIAFGATIKPLAGQGLLDAGQTVRYLALAIVPMLQYALPFAAGFGATLALHRIAADNEIQAMALGGLSYRRILRPVAALGVALTLFMVVLTQWVIPRFWTAIEQMLAADITKVFAASIGRGEAFQRGKLQVYAQDILSAAPDLADGAQSRMFLLKVAAATLDDEGRIVADVTASQAAADVHRREGRTIIKLVMKDTMGFSPESGLAELERAEHTIVVADPMRDNPKALTQGQLLALRRNPDAFAQVVEARLELLAAIGESEARAAIDAQLRSANRIELQGPPPREGEPRQRLVVAAQRMRDGQFMPPHNGRVEIVELLGETPVRRYDVDHVTLKPRDDGGLNQPGGTSFDLVLGDYEVTDLQRAGLPNTRASLIIPEVTLTSAGVSGLSELPSLELIQRMRELPQSTPRVAEEVDELVREIDELDRKIISHLFNRYALSFTALLLIMLGSVLAIYLRESLPLTIYLWSFVPAIVDLILISAGQQLLVDGRMLGHFIMWSGSGLIVVLVLVVYRKLARH